MKFIKLLLWISYGSHPTNIKLIKDYRKYTTEMLPFDLNMMRTKHNMIIQSKESLLNKYNKASETIKSLIADLENMEHRLGQTLKRIREELKYN